MSTLQNALRVLSLVSVVGGLLIAPLAAWSQDAGPARISVRLVNVNDDGVAGFEAALRDVAAALRAGGRQFFHVYQRVRGDLPGYSIITQDGAYVDLPPVELGPNIVDRLQHNGNGSTLLSVAIFPELGIAADSVRPSADFLRVRVRTVSPGNADAYFEWHEEELTPALREAGLTDLRAGRVTLGGNTNTFVRYSYTDNISGTMPALDIAGTVGQDEFNRIIEREAELLSASEDYVYRFRDDLSFTAQ